MRNDSGNTGAGATSTRTGDKLAYFFGGLIMMCAPAVPAPMSQGAPSLAFVDSPVDSAVA